MQYLQFIQHFIKQGIRLRLSMFALFFCVILLGVTSFVLYENREINKLNENITQQRFPLMVASLRLQEGCSRAESELRSYVITDDNKHKEAAKAIFDGEVATHLKEIKEMSKSWVGGDRIELLNTLIEQVQRLEALNDDITTNFLSDDTNKEMAEKLEREASPLQASIQKTLNQIISTEEKALRDEIAHSEKINILQNGFSLLSLILALPLTVLATTVLIRNIIKPVEAMREYINKLSAGELPSKMEAGGDEIGQTVAATNILIDNLSKAAAFSVKIGQGEFDDTFKPVGEGDVLGNALTEMQTRLKEVADADRKRNWATQGLAQFADVLRNNDDINKLADNVLLNLVKYLRANQGALFILNENSSEPHLEMLSCYAFDKKKHGVKQVAIGQGLVGQTFLEGSTNYIMSLPKEYVNITSGLGGATPRSLLIVPLKLNDKVEGILEIASFQTFELYEREFVEKLAENIAASISSVKTNERTKYLLSESQMQAEQMRAQEEEMRQNMEELAATQEELDRRFAEAQEKTQKLLENEEEMRQYVEELKAVQDDLSKRYKESERLSAELNARLSALNAAAILSESDLYGNITYVNDKLLEITGYTREELIGKPHSILRHSGTSKEVFVDMWKTIKSGKVFQGTYQNRKKDGSTYWVEATIAPVLDKDGKPERYVGIRFDVTQAKEAQFEVNNLLEESRMQTEELRVNEEELKQNMEELRAVQENLNQRYQETNSLGAELKARVEVLNKAAIVSESDIYGTITYANEKFCEVSGYSVEELIGKPHNLVRHPDTPAFVFKEMWDIIKAGKIFQGVIKNRKKDGSAYWVEATIAPILNEEGLPEKYIAIRFDITKQIEGSSNH